MQIWIIARALLLFLAFAFGAMGFSDLALSAGLPNETFQWSLLKGAHFLKSTIIVAIVAVLIWLPVIGLQHLNPFSAKTWSTPRWSLNPFNFRQPLQVVHFLGFLIGAFGAGVMGRAMVMSDHKIASWSMSFLEVAIGLGTVAASYLSAVIFRNKVV